jgi:hypothetical protein
MGYFSRALLVYSCEAPKLTAARVGKTGKIAGVLSRH